MRINLLIIPPTIVLVFLAILLTACHQSSVQQRKDKMASIEKSDSSYTQILDIKEKLDKLEIDKINRTNRDQYIDHDKNLGLILKNYLQRLTIGYNSSGHAGYINADKSASAFGKWIKKDTVDNIKIIMYKFANPRAVITYESFNFSNKDSSRGYLKDSSFYSSIIIFSKDYSRILTQFDILANSPYSKLDYPNIMYNKSILDESSPALNRKELEMMTYKEILSLAQTYYSTTGIAYIDDNHTCIIYNLEPLNSQGYSLGQYSTVFIVDTLGQVIINQPIYKDVKDIHLTPNGKYMAVIYGGYFGFSGFSTPGLRIYDLESKNIIHQEELNGHVALFRLVGALPTIKSIDKGLGMDNYINVVIDRHSNKFENDKGKIVIDPNGKKIYEIYYNSDNKIITSNYYNALKELDWGIRKFETP